MSSPARIKHHLAEAELLLSKAQRASTDSARQILTEQADRELEMARQKHEALKASDAAPQPRTLRR
jgi:hypothetical protein